MQHSLTPYSLLGPGTSTTEAGPASSCPSSPAAVPPAPWAGARVCFGLLRGTPVSLAEHAAIGRIARRFLEHDHHLLRPRVVAAVEGAGALRAWLEVELIAPDPDLTELSALTGLAADLRAALPGSELRTRDPLLLFSLVDGAPSVEGGEPLPDLGDLPPPPPCCLLDTTGAAGTPRPGADGGRSELVDLLQRADAGPPDVRPDPRLAAELKEALFSGLYPGAACRLMTRMPAALLDGDALAEGAQALCGDGDGSERRAATCLLRHLGRTSASTARQRRREGYDWDALALVGRQLLDQADRAGGSHTPTLLADLDDDLDPGDPEGEAPLDTLDGILQDLADDPLVAGLAPLANEADYGTRVTARLSGDDDAAAGAVVMLLLGQWPASRTPGWATALLDLATGDRPDALRAVALRALGRLGGPDATALLLDATRWSDPGLAGAALRGLAWMPTAPVRQRLRDAVADDATAVPALLALADAVDVGAFALVAAALTERSEPIAAAAARTLAVIGGRRALPALEGFLSAAAGSPVSTAAAAAIAAVMPADHTVELLGGRSTDAQAAALRAAGTAGRVDLLSWICSCARDARPELRQAAADALGALGVTVATPLLLALLLDEDVPVAIAALDALTTAGDSRCVRLLRLLAAHPGLPGRRATRVLAEGRHLRRPPPDDRVQVRMRSPHRLAVADLALVEQALGAAGLQTGHGDHLVTGDARVDLLDSGALLAIVHALQAVDALLPGLQWSVRDGAGLLRRGPDGWMLSARAGRIVRDAGGWTLDAPSVTRVPLAAEVVERPADPGAADALPVGTAQPDPLDDEPFDEDLDDDRTEQTISAFLEEVTGLGAPGGDPAPSSAEPAPGAPPAAEVSATTGAGAVPPRRGRPGDADGHEELLFDLEH